MAMSESGAGGGAGHPGPTPPTLSVGRVEGPPAGDGSFAVRLAGRMTVGTGQFFTVAPADAAGAAAWPLGAYQLRVAVWPRRVSFDSAGAGETVIEFDPPALSQQPPLPLAAGAALSLMGPLGRPDAAPVPEPVACAPADFLRCAEAAAKGGVARVVMRVPIPCGTGACQGCIVPVKSGGMAGGYRLACVDGPVFDAAEIDWGRLPK